MYRFSWVVLFGFYPAKWFFFKYRNGTEFVHSWKRISIMRLCYRVFFTGFSVDRTTRRLAGTPLFSVGDVPALLFFSVFTACCSINEFYLRFHLPFWRVTEFYRVFCRPRRRWKANRLEMNLSLSLSLSLSQPTKKTWKKIKKKKKRRGGYQKEEEKRRGR